MTMTIARLQDFTCDIVDYLHQMPGRIVDSSVAAANWAKRHLSNIFGSFGQNQIVKSLHTHYIQNLDLKDGFIFVAFTATACLISLVAIPLLITPFLPLIVMTSFLFICISIVIIKKRLENKTNREVAEIYTTFIEELKKEEPQTNEIEKARDFIRQVAKRRLCDDRFKEEMKSLDNHMKHHLDNISQGNTENYEKIKAAFLTYTEETQKRLA